ncbi:MAG: CcdB family protein [Rhodocyclaceae bacterium]|nr:CcdB family protein [Rhodocyclaceae bacterium]
MSQYDIYPNPGSLRDAIPFLVSVQNDHITRHTGTTVVIPLRANTLPVEVLAPVVSVEGHGTFVLSANEVFAIDTTRLKSVVAKLTSADRGKIRSAIDKVLGDY